LPVNGKGIQGGGFAELGSKGIGCHDLRSPGWAQQRPQAQNSPDRLLYLLRSILRSSIADEIRRERQEGVVEFALGQPKLLANCRDYETIVLHSTKEEGDGQEGRGQREEWSTGRPGNALNV
jgi:hypothetical protein